MVEKNDNDDASDNGGYQNSVKHTKWLYHQKKVRYNSATTKNFTSKFTEFCWQCFAHAL